MPIYEYRCAKCQRKTSIFVRGFTVDHPPACSQCGNAETNRVMSTFAMVHSESIENMDIDEMAKEFTAAQGSPQAMAQHLREMNAKRGPDPELDEILGRMDKGEVPDDLHGALAGEGFHSHENDDPGFDVVHGDGESGDSGGDKASGA